MKNILKSKSNIDTSKTDVFVAEKDTIWNGINIFKDSLVAVYNKKIFVNEMDTNFKYLLLEIYPEVSEYLSDDEELVIPHPQDCKDHFLFDNEFLNGTISIETGGMSRWNKDHFCTSGVPKKEELLNSPTFKYNGVEYSSWGYQINTDTKEIENGFYIKDNKYFEMVGMGLEDLEVKS
ncbi:MAG: hypothetical protein WC121_08555 [Candidatus Kapaibacterium sp.]